MGFLGFELILPLFQPDLRGRGQRVHLLFARNVDFPKGFKGFLAKRARAPTPTEGAA